MEIVTLSTDQLRSLIREAIIEVESDRRKAAELDAAGLSLVKASRLAGKRPQTVSAAIAAGHLTAHRTGPRRWVISSGAVRRWVESGCPASPAAAAKAD